MRKFGIPVFILIIGLAATAFFLSNQNVTRDKSSAVTTESVVGVLTDLTSYTAEYGQQERAGLQVLADQTNSKESQTRIKLLIQDTKGSPKEAINGVNQILSTESKPRLIFSALSSVSMAVLPVTDSKETLVICNATSKAVVDSALNSIRNFPDPEQEIDLLIKGAIEPLNISKVGVIYINDEYGQSMAKLVEEKAEANSYNNSLKEAYGFDTSDFRPFVQKLISSDAGSVIVVGYGSQAGSLIRQLKENGFNGRILVPSLIVNTDSVSNTAGAALEGVIFNGFNYQFENEELSNFTKSFERIYKGKQSDIGVLAYVGTKIILDHTLPKANPVDAMSQLQKASPFPTILGDVRFDGRSFVYPMKIYSVIGGEVTPFTGEGKQSPI